MKIFAESRHFIRRSPNSIFIEDVEARCKRHEISEAAYNFYKSEILNDIKPLKNSDGSISYSYLQNSNEATEETFWFEEI